MRSGHACGSMQVHGSLVNKNLSTAFLPSSLLHVTSGSSINDGTFSNGGALIPFHSSISSQATPRSVVHTHTSYAGLPGSLRCFWLRFVRSTSSLPLPIIYTPHWAHRAPHSLCFASIACDPLLFALHHSAAHSPSSWAD